MNDEPQHDDAMPGPAVFGGAAAVYAQRDGKILVLKRAMGEAVGGWWLPGGAVDPGESFEQAARRELFEEAGLTPTGPLVLINVTQLPVYGGISASVSYAADCPDGDVVISHEHSGARWIDPYEFRDRFFGDALIEQVCAQHARMGGLMAVVRGDLDQYIAWREHQFLDHQLRVMRLTAEMYVLRDGKMLLLKRAGTIGNGVWYLPGGIVEPGEDPMDAAVRETLEETGLTVHEPRLLRVWSYGAENGLDAYHAAYIAEAPAGDVTISDEHSAYRWMAPEEYVARYCGAQAEASAPQWSRWFAQVRINCALVGELAHKTNP